MERERMAKLGRAWIVASLAGALVAVPVDGQEVVGVNSAVRNDVKTRRDAQGTYREAVVKEKVALGNQVRTGSASALQVTLLDKSNLTVGPNAFFTVDRFAYDPAGRTTSMGASVAKGTFRFMSGKARKEGANVVKTPAASIGIRGTIFEGAVGADALLAARQQGLALPAGTDPETATMIVLRGPGPKAQMGEPQGRIEVMAGGRTILLDRPGQALFVPYPGAVPIGPFPIAPASYATFDEVLRTTPGAFAPTLTALVNTPPPPGSTRANPKGTSGRTLASGSVASGKIGSGVLIGLGGAAAIAGIVVATTHETPRYRSNGV
ncbi:FecR domain-containing protein [Novosphingobium profundi]|uniref:FecR family protein n=1 Tax=Novosphingobium profundi TaxID=1774954 RepID=UPI001BDB0C15|nr:FecR domain-containing protein [Novosphingobium profundi]MBT0670973.1 FecR domain-containing protein [Novosphingobium profundi]